MGIYSTFQGASSLPLHNRSGWTARGWRRDRDRCARSDRVCAAHQPGTVTPTHEESLGEGETLHPKCHAPSWSRSISIHPRSRITANWTLIQVTGTKSNATALLLWSRSLRGSEEEGWDCCSGVREWVCSRLPLFSFAYKEGVLRNMSMLPGMNHSTCSST